MKDKDADWRTDTKALLTFRDINKPVTVEQVDPANLAARCAQGYSLRRITVEIIDEPVASGIKKISPWLRVSPARLFTPIRQTRT